MICCTTFERGEQQKKARPNCLRYILLNYGLASGDTLSDQVTRAATGDIVSGTELGQNKNYSYDTAGRLIGATIAGNTYTYGYDSQDTSCATSTNALSGKDSNRTSQTVNGVTTTYCYDYADRLVSSSDPTVTNATYDSHGNTTSLGDVTHVTNFTYDSSDRLVSMNEPGKSATVNYVRDSQGRIVTRSENTSSTTKTTLYGYTASGDTPDYLTDASGNITEKYLTLPGNVTLTVRPQSQSASVQTWSLPNIHGDNFATVNADGSLVSTTLTGPYGEQMAGQQTPDNLTGTATYGYLGQYQKEAETAFTLQPVDMGERTYIPGLGRFLQMDPQQGGTPSNYVYPPDPVNDNDLTGDFGWKSFATITSVGSMIPGPIGMASAACSAAAYAAAGDKKNAALMAAGIALAAVGGGAAIKAVQVARNTKNVGRVANLAEKLALKEVRANPQAGRHIMAGKIKDPKYSASKGWQKMEYIHTPLTNKSKKVIVHYFYKPAKKTVKQIKIKRYR